MTNTQQLIDNTKNYANAIVESEMAGEEDNVKAEVTRLLMRNLPGSYIDYNSVDSCIERARLNIAISKDDNGDDEGSY